MICPVLSGVDAVAIGGIGGIGEKALAVRGPLVSTGGDHPLGRLHGCGGGSGVTIALELGPGAALSRMLRGRHPQIACRSVAEFRSIDGVLKWLERQADLA